MCLQLLALVTDGCCMRGRCTSSTSLTGVIIYARGPLSVHIKRCLAGVTGVGLATTNQDRFKSPRDVVYCLACSTNIVASFTRSKLNSLDLNLSRQITHSPIYSRLKAHYYTAVPLLLRNDAVRLSVRLSTCPCGRRTDVSCQSNFDLWVQNGRS